MGISAVGLYWCNGHFANILNDSSNPTSVDSPGKDNVGKELQIIEIPVQQNLPQIDSPLFGREHDLETLAHFLVSRSARIININGPPAFGKSTLAIKLGEKLLESKSTTTVRYIDTETTRPSWYLCTHSTAPNDPPTYDDNNGRRHAVQNFTGSSNPNYSPFYDEPDLCEWSQSLKTWSVLILDNCDHILNGEWRNQFIGVIHNHLRQGRVMHLSIIVTSQERLEFLNNAFTSWPLQELTPNDSVALLQHYLPDLSVEYAFNFSSIVGHCPLALKVIGRLLAKRSKSIQSLFDQLVDHVVGTISDRITDNKERFRAIMDVAYDHLDPETQMCSRIISLFPGSFHAIMGEKVVGNFMDPSCIQKVVQKSFSEEIFSANQIRYSMHKLIRDYFTELHQENSTLFDQTNFSSNFMSYYSSYLKSLMVSAYSSWNITNEELYTYLYLEAHNVQKFAQLVLVEPTLSENAALSLGFIINENLIPTNGSGDLYRNVLRKAYQVFTQNLDIFAKLCRTSTTQLCANIYWKTVVSVGVPQCTQNTTSYNFVYYWDVIHSFSGSKPCSFIFGCTNLTTLRHQNTISHIQQEVMKSAGSDNHLLFSMMNFKVRFCQVGEWSETPRMILLKFTSNCFHSDPAVLLIITLLLVMVFLKYSFRKLGLNFLIVIVLDPVIFYCETVLGVTYFRLGLPVVGLLLIRVTLLLLLYLCLEPLLECLSRQLHTNSFEFLIHCLIISSTMANLMEIRGFYLHPNNSIFEKFALYSLHITSIISCRSSNEEDFNEYPAPSLINSYKRYIYVIMRSQKLELLYFIINHFNHIIFMPLFLPYVFELLVSLTVFFETPDTVSEIDARLFV